MLKKHLHFKNPYLAARLKRLFAWAQYLKDAAEYVQENWNELLFMRKDLSSK
jgi:hypothetical protein